MEDSELGNDDIIPVNLFLALYTCIYIYWPRFIHACKVTLSQAREANEILLFYCVYFFESMLTYS